MRKKTLLMTVSAIVLLAIPAAVSAGVPMRDLMQVFGEIAKNSASFRAADAEAKNAIKAADDRIEADEGVGGGWLWRYS